jgi:antitoxin component YwqK of YwqJK toxin-antitoxin module
LISCNSKIEIIEKFANGEPRKIIEHYENDSTCEKTFHENGKIEEIKCFKNGKQSGEQIVFYKENGSKRALMTFRNGTRHGPSYEYYPSGQKAFEGIVIDGEFEGLSKWYFKNGNLNFIGSRHSGKDTGWWYYFNMQGDTIRRSYTRSISDTTEYFDGSGKKITSDEWEKITREE